MGIEKSRRPIVTPVNRLNATTAVFTGFYHPNGKKIYRIDFAVGVITDQGTATFQLPAGAQPVSMRGWVNFSTGGHVIPSMILVTAADSISISYVTSTGVITLTNNLAGSTVAGGTLTAEFTL